MSILYQCVSARLQYGCIESGARASARAKSKTRQAGMEILHPENACVVVRILATLEHASYLWRGKKYLPEPFVSDPLGEHSQVEETGRCS